MLPPLRPKPILPGAERRVQLMATCICDAFYDDVARATVEVLEHLGCAVEFPEGQTCCGQPAFNSGNWPESRQVVRHTAQVFSGDGPIVVPSGSCAGMLRHGARLEFEHEKDLPEITQLGRRSWELADFIVNGLGVTSWPGKYPALIAFHCSCHSRGTDSGAATRLLLSSIAGTRVVPFGEEEQCCGFGGTFAVSFPHISKGIGTLKLDHLRTADAEVVVSGDMGCLMHLSGLAEKAGRPIRAQHLAQILRDALSGSHIAHTR